jgi:gas vesicle protein
MNQEQQNTPQDNGKGGGFFAGFIVGAIAGAAIAYLITQEEARDLIAGKAREAGNYAMDATGDLRSKAADLYERGKNVVENARSNIDAAVGEGQTSADKIRDDLSRQTSDS